MTLDDLGTRICLFGPSNSGKSTLAAGIGAARGLPVIHLDQLHHRPDPDWEPRPAAEFDGLHAAAIAGERWVMDGNYSRLMPARLARATGAIVLDVPTATSLWRYLRRSWFERARHGGLAGGRDSVKWDMLHHIVATAPGRQDAYARLLAPTGLPVIRLRGGRALTAFYRAEKLPRVAPG